MSRLDEIKGKYPVTPSGCGSDLNWLIEELEKAREENHYFKWIKTITERDKAYSALEAIMKHQEVIGGDMGKITTCYRIAEQVLIDKTEDICEDVKKD